MHNMTGLLRHCVGARKGPRAPKGTFRESGRKMKPVFPRFLPTWWCESALLSL